MTVDNKVFSIQQSVFQQIKGLSPNAAMLGNSLEKFPYDGDQLDVAGPQPQVMSKALLHTTF